VREFLADTGMTAAQIDRVAYLVGHHHSPVMSWIFPSEKAIIFSMICAMVIICFTPVFNT